MELINHSHYKAGIAIDMDRDGAETLVLIVKATFDILPDGRVERSMKQRDIEWADVYVGDPGASSVLYESDATWGRFGTDIALIGYAYPKRLGHRSVDVALRVGESRKLARVFGDRQWQTSLGVTRMSDPQPFDRIPLVWERSFGGTDLTPENPVHHAQEARNPVGRGFRAKESRRDLEGEPLPNIEAPKHLISSPNDRPPPTGFGFVAKHWMPRVAFAGTYDDEWQRTRAPLLPDDYDPRFTVAASDGLSARSSLQGGEVVELIQMTPDGQLRFALPRVPIRGFYLVDAKLTSLDMGLVVVFIDAVSMRLILVWHGTQSIHGQIDDIRWVHALDEADSHVASAA